MSKEIIVEITIEGNKLKTFSQLQIKQAFNAHHTFELIIDHDALEETGTHTLQNSQSYIGCFITACFGQRNSGDNAFKGIITEVSLDQGNGLWGSLVLKGYSPTYLMEGGAHHASFYERKLNDMFSEATKSVASNDMTLVNKPQNTSKITYMCQYGESNFAFINRLSAEYSEFFYYDGLHLFFGKPEQDTIDMIYGEQIERMRFSMRMAPVSVQHYSYNSKDNQVLSSVLPSSVSGADGYTNKAVEVSGKMFAQTVNQPVPIRTSTKGDLDQYAENHLGRLAANLVVLSGEGDEPKLKLGYVMKVKVSQKGLGAGQNEHGEYLVTALNHYITGTGSYSNSFEAIPSANKVIPFDIAKPVAEAQLATVKDNADPEGLGRVRVQMLWQQPKGQLTDWIRVLTPDAGSSEKVGSNRGFVFIPEVGDQVMLGFRYNDPNRPFVMGSVFHGKTGGGGGSSNNSKSLTTKSGSTITLNEGAGSVSVVDAKGNKMTMDGGGNIAVSSQESITLSCGASKLELKKDGTVNLNGKTITVDGTDAVNTKTKEHKINATNNTITGKNHITGGDTKIDGGNVFIN